MGRGCGAVQGCASEQGNEPGEALHSPLVVIARKESSLVLFWGKKTSHCFCRPYPLHAAPARADAVGWAKGSPVARQGSGGPLPHLCWEAPVPADAPEVHARPGKRRIIAYTFVKSVWPGLSVRSAELPVVLGGFETVLHS